MLREQARLVLVAQTSAYSPQYLSNLIVLVSGFEISTIEEVVLGETFIVVCVGSAVTEVRQPFGVHGPGVVARVNESQEARSEFYFQIGTLILQTGDAELAIHSFRSVLVIEPNNAEAYFGLGMTYGTQNRWTEAITELQRSKALDPTSAEVERWIQLAQQPLAQAVQPAAPAATQSEHSRGTVIQPAAPQVAIPRVAPALVGTRALSQVSIPGAITAPTASGAVPGQGGASPAPPQPNPTATQTTSPGSLRI